jgi:hypothetical protein
MDDNNIAPGLFDELIMHIEKAYSQVVLASPEAFQEAEFVVVYSFLVTLREELGAARTVLEELTRNNVDPSVGYIERWQEAAQEEAEYQHEIAILKAENRALKERITNG